MDIDHILQKVFSNVPGIPPGPYTIRPISGGSINGAFQIATDSNNRWFAKFNDAHHFPHLFVTESRGLSLLQQTGIFHTPNTIACTQIGNTQVLILDWIDEGPQTPAFWHNFGESLARLHQTTSPFFGLEENNYMGALPQDNTPSSEWVEFFMQNRLIPQIQLAANKGLLDKTFLKHFERLYNFLPEIFPPEPPSLLHGDLWSGNFLCNANSAPVLIDPAVYYGHRSIDLGMTTLFGGFDPVFYDAYHHHYPLPANHRLQWQISNLYPLLIHLNLFGRSYLSNIFHTIQHF